MVEQHKGLVIRASHDVEEAQDRDTVTFVVSFGEKESQHIFVPLNDAQKKAAARFYGDRLRLECLATIELKHREKKFTWGAFYPFGVSLQRVEPPKKMGIGTLVHYAITEYLAREHNLQDYEVSHDPDASDERIRQLERMNIEHRVPYQFTRYREIVRQAIVKRFGAEPKLEMP